MTDAPKPPRLVPWTNSQYEALKWSDEGKVIVCRTVLTGHSGHGIIIASTPVELVKASLYTQYVPKSHEFRVHIIRGDIIDVQRKIRDPNKEPTDWKVRSHDNGFIYVRGGFVVPEDVKRQSLSAFMASGLDFGAVDVIWSEKQQKAYVLEINTAPGLENTTVESYANGFKRQLGG
jgi:glutathione synthase/RimK-type ligase-like ATP-grasp enzyme